MGYELNRLKAQVLRLSFFIFMIGLSTSWAQVEKSSELYKTIEKLDKEFFEAYNSCDKNLERYGAFYDQEIEFYHDQGGLMTSKQDIIDATQLNICGNVKRELVAESIEVYPIKDFGAVQMGYHKFHNLVEGSISEPVRFIVIWKVLDDSWKIKRVISLH